MYAIKILKPQGLPATQETPFFGVKKVVVLSKVKLTEKQKRFIDFYIETGNATEAARKVGYKGKNLDNVGSENLGKLGIHIQTKMKAKDSQRIAKGDEVLQFLTSVMRGEMTEEVPLFVGKGFQELESKGASIRDRTEAAKQLAKRYGLDQPESIVVDAGDSANRAYILNSRLT